MPKGSRTCEIAGCDRPHHARGLCNVCYVRAHRKRNPEYRERERRAERARKRPPRVEYWREYRRRAEVRERERRRHRDAWSRNRDDPEYLERRRARDRRRYRRMGGQGYQRHRGTLVLRQQFACAICGGPLDRELAHVDHIIPVSRGGGNEIENLQAVHATCNRRKGNR